MASHRYAVAGALSFAMILAGGGGLPALTGTGAAAHHHERCLAGAHTLSAPGSHVYPDTGNGGYTSLHTDVRLVYDATGNRFLPGNHVTLTDRATQCLTSFSLDFERKSANASAGPDMAVNSVTVNGRPAVFRFVQPTYPGDPNGQDDPDPLAHEASQLNPVGGPAHNPLPPACSPELASTSVKPNSKNGTQCPANKLVITPTAPIERGGIFSVTVAYTGRPGVHNDGDGTTEGWFRSNRPKGDGGFVTTEPLGTEDWMPLNDHPSAKPTYDFADTVNAGKTVLANGVLVSRAHHPPDSRFPHGSVTWHWHSAAPVASYLVENSVGRFDLTERTIGGIKFYQAQASSLSAARKAKNRAIMNKQPDITRFESMFTGPFPFISDGVVVGRPSASFEEEMQGMITFAGGEIDTDTLYHENMHQWWGDHVTEASYNLTLDPGHVELCPGTAAGPAPLRRRRHYRGPAGGGVPPLAADPGTQRAAAGSTSSSGSGSTPPISPAAAPAGPTSPVLAWQAPGSTREAAPGERLTIGTVIAPTGSSLAGHTGGGPRREPVIPPRGGENAGRRRLILPTRAGRLCPWTLVWPSCRWIRSRC
jgi:hypothetical protein